MKITFVLGGGFGLSGGERVVATYADRLQKRGHDICIVARPLKLPTCYEQLRSIVKGHGWLPDPNPQVSHFDHLSPCTVRYLLKTCRPVTEADVPDADVIVATWWETAHWIAGFSPAKGAKAYLIQHHEVFDYLPREQVQATYRLPMHKITISKWLVEMMRTEYDDRTVSLVPNSVDTKQFYAPPRNKQPVPTVGILYNPTPWKACGISLKAVAIAAQKMPNLRLVALSDFAPNENLPLPPNVEFVLRPPQSQIRDLYAKCDAWLFSSQIEGFGLTILEAMACRTPVIGTPAGAAPELLSDGAGILIQPNDPEAMAEAILQVVQMSNSEWRALSDAAYTRAANYTWDDATDRFEQALQLAIDRTRHGDFSALVSS